MLTAGQTSVVCGPNDEVVITLTWHVGLSVNKTNEKKETDRVVRQIMIIVFLISVIRSLIPFRETFPVP